MTQIREIPIELSHDPATGEWQAEYKDPTDSKRRTSYLMAENTKGAIEANLPAEIREHLESRGLLGSTEPIGIVFSSVAEKPTINHECRLQRMRGAVVKL